MSKPEKPVKDDLRSEYKRSDFDTLVRGKYAERMRKCSNVVVIDPDLAPLFPNSQAVNGALHSLAEIAKRTKAPRRR